MRLYSYRGVAYTIAPPALSPTHHDRIDEPSSVEQTLEQSPKHSSEKSDTQDIASTLPQFQIPTAVIPMVYRGVLHFLERFHTSCPSPDEKFIDASSDESIESIESAESTKSVDE